MTRRRIDQDLSRQGWRVRLNADIHMAVQINTRTDRREAASSTSAGTTDQTTRNTTSPRSDMSNDMQGLSTDELAAEGGEQLPEREQMSLINGNVAAPINAAVALNALSDNSTAYASATQDAPIVQGN